MPQIVYVHPNGRREALDLPLGTSVMQGATTHGIDGILAECGGNAMCATCHVYVEPQGLESLPPMSADEDALLDGTASERRPNSRLSCQLLIKAELEDVVVNLPEAQV